MILNPGSIMKFSAFWCGLSNNLTALSTFIKCSLFIVQGRHLELGSRKVDFVIKLGDSECVPVSLSDNQVDCRPPLYRPNKNTSDSFCHRDTISLQVIDRPTMWNCWDIPETSYVLILLYRSRYCCYYYCNRCYSYNCCCCCPVELSLCDEFTVCSWQQWRRQTIKSGSA